MRKFDVQIALEKVAEARREWAQRQREFQDGVNSVMAVLIHEAARNYMSPQEVQKAAGLTRTQVKDLMRRNGLNPADGKRMLSAQAAKALTENAALLGVHPHEMDLTSPLAYLPMGEQLKRQLQDQTVSQVHEFPETELAFICPDCGGEFTHRDMAEGVR